jgi:hypothetical protein
MEYLDFELRIAPGSGRDYPVAVLQSPAGQSSATMTFPFDTLALQTQLQGVEIAVLRSAGTRRDVVTEEHVDVAGEAHLGVSEFGKGLFEALMSDTIRENFRRSQDRARAAGKGLRLRLRIEAPELAALPWEYLYDASEGDYICLSADTPLVRYLEFDRPPEPMTIKPPLSILGMIASPSDRASLDVAREKQRVEAATAGLCKAGLLKLTWLEGSTWRDLQKAMRQGPYHVFHFVGHGGFDAASDEGVIALTDDDGKMELLNATQLGRLLADHQSLRMVVLNACLGAKGSTTDLFSSTASILVRRGVSAVVAMQYEISDRAAIEFARSLYEALADGMPVDAAVSEARKAISLSASNSVEWGTPVLHMRSPDGALFQINGLTTSAARASGVYHAVPPTIPDAQPAPSAPPSQSAPPPVAAPAAAVSAPPAISAAGIPSRLRWLAIGAGAALLLVLLLVFQPWSRGGGASDDGTAPTWASTHAKVRDVALDTVSRGVMNLILTIDYRPPAVRGDADVACVLRRGDPEQRDVDVPVILSPDYSGGDFDEQFSIREPWESGKYPVECSVGGESVFEGDIDWQK